MRTWLWVGAALGIGLAACGGSTVPGGSAGTGGGAGTGGSAGTGGAAGGGGTCGGLIGAQCDSAKWCDYTPDRCGNADQPGTCRARPDTCSFLYAPVCGCDGKVYDNECAAQMAGADKNEQGGCEPPQNDIPCGWTFCDGTMQYCEKSLSDTGGPNGYTCKPLPDACKNLLDCGCFPATTPCRDQCLQVFGNGVDGFVLTCPGG